MGFRLVTAPSTYPVTLEEAKDHLEVDFDDKNAKITMCIASATANAEKFLGRSLIDQTWDYFLDRFPTTKEISIPLPPTIEIIGAFYLDSAGDEQEFPSSSYSLVEPQDSNKNSRLVIPTTGSWPTTQEIAGAVRIRFRAGYLDTNSPPSAAVPFDIKAGILLNVGSLFAHREDVVVGQTSTLLPKGSESFLRPHRVLLGMA